MSKPSDTNAPNIVAARGVMHPQNIKKTQAELIDEEMERVQNALDSDQTLDGEPLQQAEQTVNATVKFEILHTKAMRLWSTLQPMVNTLSRTITRILSRKQ